MRAVRTVDGEFTVVEVDELDPSDSEVVVDIAASGICGSDLHLQGFGIQVTFGHECAGHLADGTIANHLINWLSPLKERMVTVTGANGAFVADTLTGDLTWFANADVPNEWDALSVLRGAAEGDMIRYAYPKPEPLKVEHETFRDAVLGISDNVVTMTEGLLVVKTCEDVLTSATR